MYTLENTNLPVAEVARLNRVVSAASCGRPADCDAVLWLKWVRDGIDSAWSFDTPSSVLLDRALKNAGEGWSYMAR